MTNKEFLVWLEAEANALAQQDITVGEFMLLAIPMVFELTKKEENSSETIILKNPKLPDDYEGGLLHSHWKKDDDENEGGTVKHFKD